MRDILESYNVSELRKEISKLSNEIKRPFSGYSTMKKTNLIELMIKNKQHFGHLKKEAPKKAAPKKIQVKKAAPKKIQVKKAAPKKIQVKKIEPKKTAPKKATPKKIEPKKIQVKKIEPKKTAPKKIEPKKTQINKEINEKLSTFLNYLKSPSKRQFNYLSNLGFSANLIDTIKSNMKLTDFYPTPRQCVQEASEYIKDSSNIIDPACGLGFPLLHINEINPKAKIQGIEFNNNTFNVAKQIFSNSNIEIKKGNFFDIPLKNTYDYYFLNPPFTSGYSKKDNYYIKFILYLGILLENSKIKTVYSQILFPTKFLKERPGDIVQLHEVVLKTPLTELKRYFKELDFFNKIGIDIDIVIKEYKKELEKGEKYDIKDVYYDILDGVFNGEIIYLSNCKFETTKFKIANLMFIRRLN